MPSKWRTHLGLEGTSQVFIHTPRGWLHRRAAERKMWSHAWGNTRTKWTQALLVVPCLARSSDLIHKCPGDFSGSLNCELVHTEQHWWMVLCNQTSSTNAVGQRKVEWNGRVSGPGSASGRRGPNSRLVYTPPTTLRVQNVHPLWRLVVHSQTLLNAFSGGFNFITPFI